MNLVLVILLFAAGLGLVLFCAEQLVKGIVGTSMGFGVSTFLISIIFFGFDPDNLFVGATGSFENVAGIAWGSIIGAAMVAVAFGFGLSVLLAPMQFEAVPRRVLAVPVLAIPLLWALSLDGLLSRIDGAILLVGYAWSLLWLVHLSRKGLSISPTGEVAESLERAGAISRWKAAALFLAALVGIVVGSELLIAVSESLIKMVGLSETFFGMVILAFLVSIDELAKEIPAAIKGRPEISFGNVVGSILAIILFNAGLIALVHPLEVPPYLLSFYLPYGFGTVLVVTLLVLKKKVPRWAGGILVLLYLGFVVGSYLL